MALGLASLGLLGIMARPSSPLLRDYLPQVVSQDEGTLSSPYANLISAPPLTLSDVPSEHDMGRENSRPQLEILVDSECLFLKGTGVDVEPARLSGYVALYLTEATAIKEITLQFRGKARLPAPHHDSYAIVPNLRSN